jgi:hypothetical protein
MYTNNLPDDPKELNSIIIDYQNQVSHFEEKIDFLQRSIFGAKSEKICDIQTLENHLLLPGFEEQLLEDITPQKITVFEHTCKKRGRKPLPPELPRDEIIHDLPEEEKTCACGTPMTCIGQEVSERIHYVPAQVRVEQHIRYK